MDRKEQAKALRCILESRLSRSQTKISLPGITARALVELLRSLEEEENA